GMADEERFSAGRGPQVQSARRLGRGRLSGPTGRAAQDAVLQLGCARTRERGHLDAHPDQQGNQSAHGAKGLPARSGAVLSGGQGGVGELLRQARAGAGAERLTSRGFCQRRPDVTRRRPEAYAARGPPQRRSARVPVETREASCRRSRALTLLAGTLLARLSRGTAIVRSSMRARTAPSASGTPAPRPCSVIRRRKPWASGST